MAGLPDPEFFRQFNLKPYIPPAAYMEIRAWVRMNGFSPMDEIPDFLGCYVHQAMLERAEREEDALAEEWRTREDSLREGPLE